MSKIASIILVALLFATMFMGNAMAAKQEDSAPNSGDGIADGSGWESNHWPDAGMGPAPNAGDGTSDGSGF